MARFHPAAEFTIPSIHDSTPLSARLYLPTPTSQPRDSTAQRNASSDRPTAQATAQLDSGAQRKFAVVAHPYAPLGGSYDDPVVWSVGDALLRLGYVVCTFNFRGAHGSAGRTSWSSQPEKEDYMSIVGFMVAYMSFLAQTADTSGSSTKAPVEGILAGYSYGSMVVTMLPDPTTFLSDFTNPTSGVQKDIVTRARTIATEGRRSDGPAKFELPALKFRFLLVAPLLPPVTSVLAMNISIPFWGSGSSCEGSSTAVNESVLAEYPTLAVYGSGDMFAAARRLGAWAEGMGKSNPRFEKHRVDGAGHFWIEEGAIQSLLTEIERWVSAG